MSEEPNYVKVVVHVERDDDTWHSFETEGLWAVPEAGGLYRINIPFYSYGISNDDVVSVAEEADLGLVVQEIRELSDFSTVRIWVHEPGSRAEACARFEALGCDYEPAHDHLISVSIPRARLEQVMKEIEAGASREQWAWEEGSLRY